MRACENRGPPPLPKRPFSPPVSGGEETYWEGRRDASSPPVFKSAGRRAQARTPGCGCVRAGGPAPVPGGRGWARHAWGWEGRRNAPKRGIPIQAVRAIAPLCIFSGEVTCPLFSSPPFSAGPSGVPVRAGQPAWAPGSGVADVHAGWRKQARAPDHGRVRARWPARSHPRLSARPRTHLPVLLASLFSLEFFNFLTDISV